jgi:hypothetical protein
MENPITSGEKKKSPLMYILMGCGGIVLLGVVIGALTIFGAAKLITEPTNVAKSFVDTIIEGDYETAYDTMTSNSFQETTPREEFLASETDDSPFTDAATVSFSSFNIENNTALVGGMLQGPEALPLTVILHKVDGTWLVSGLSFEELILDNDNDGDLNADADADENEEANN